MSDPRLRRNATAGDGRVRMGVSLFYFEETLRPARAGKTGGTAGGSKAGSGKTDQEPKARTLKGRREAGSPTMWSAV